MRKPYQILVFPFKKEEKEYKFAIFYREDLKVWQGIAGGVEENETPIEAAKREAYEEAGIDIKSKYIELEANTTMPVLNVVKDFIWGKDVLLIKEYSFGVEINKNTIIKLSKEHLKYEWVTFDEAYKKLKWDSNKTAIWELNQRIKRRKLEDGRNSI